MTPVQTALAWSVGLFVGMLVCLEVGYRIGSYGVERHQELEHEGTGAIEAAVFALLGLLLAFTFGGAMTRLETRRELIVQEANAIGTAYLRLDVLPAADSVDAAIVSADPDALARQRLRSCWQMPRPGVRAGDSTTIWFTLLAGGDND